MEDVCPICLETLPADPAVLPCCGKHAFCAPCVAPLQQLGCPVCRDDSDAVAAFLLQHVSGTEEWLLEQGGVAARRGRQGVLAQVAQRVGVDARRKDGRTLLFAAAAQEDCAELLLARGADPNARDQEGQTPLMVAARTGSERVVELLLGAGAAVEDRCSVAYTALRVAAQRGHAGVVQRLLAAGAEINTRSVRGTTPLMAAAQHGEVAVVQTLLAAPGRDLEAVPKHGYRALHTAARSGEVEVVRLLLAAGAEPDPVSVVPPELQQAEQLGALAELFTALFGRPPPWLHTYLNAQTPLMLAAAAGHRDVVRVLLDAGAQKDLLPPGAGKTARELAEQHGHHGVARLLSLRRPGPAPPCTSKRRKC